MKVQHLIVSPSEVVLNGHELYESIKSIEIEIEGGKGKAVSYIGCTNCSYVPQFEVVHGKMSVIEPCTYEGDGIHQIKIDIPSGKMVVFNGLLNTYSESLENFFNRQGRAANAKECEAAGFINEMIPVPPEIYCNSERNSVLFANLEPEIYQQAGYNLVEQVKGGYWDYIISDFDLYLNNSGTNNKHGMFKQIVVFDVIPGTYSFCYYVDHKNFNLYEENAIYMDGVLIKELS